MSRLFPTRIRQHSEREHASDQKRSGAATIRHSSVGDHRLLGDKDAVFGLVHAPNTIDRRDVIAVEGYREDIWYRARALACHDHVAGIRIKLRSRGKLDVVGIIYTVKSLERVGLAG